MKTTTPQGAITATSHSFARACSSAPANDFLLPINAVRADVALLTLRFSLLASLVVAIRMILAP